MITQEEKTNRQSIPISSLNVFDDRARGRVYIKNVNVMIIGKLSTKNRRLVFPETTKGCCSPVKRTHVRRDVVDEVFFIQFSAK